MKSICLRATMFAFAISSLPLVAQTVKDNSLTVDVVAPLSSFDQPTCMVFIGPNQLLVGEKATGKVRFFNNGNVETTAVLDLPVNSQSERGLLGLALDPDFATNKYVYVRYTRASADGQVALDQSIVRYTWTGTILNTPTPLSFALPTNAGPNHNGGPILFGPPGAAPSDQKLFGVVGDLNRDYRTENYKGSLAPDDSASVFRVNHDGSSPTGAQRGPFYDVAGSNGSFQRLYAYGIRNSFGLDFDPVTGSLWDTENGPDRYDEINRVEPGSNSGWQRVMGPSTANDSIITGMGLEDLDTLGNVGVYSEPEFSWRQVVAPTAIHFLRSSKLGAQYLNTCFVGCDNNDNLYHFIPNENRDGFTFTDPNLNDKILDTSAGDSDASIVFGTGFPVVTSITTGPDGYMYLLSLSQGTIYRIRPKVTAVDDWQEFD